VTVMILSTCGAMPISKGHICAVLRATHALVQGEEPDAGNDVLANVKGVGYVEHLYGAGVKLEQTQIETTGIVTMNGPLLHAALTIGDG
jgi:hypothetical protein